MVALVQSKLRALNYLDLFSTESNEVVSVVQEVAFFALHAAYAADLDPSGTSPSHPCHGIRQILTNGYSYLSKDRSFDLSSRLASRLEQSGTPSVYHPLARLGTSPALARPPLVTSLPLDPTFTFKYFILSPLLELRAGLTPDDRKLFSQLGCAIPLIQGFYGQRQVSIGPENDHATLTIISRLSPNRSGTRCLCRGADQKGAVANHAEESPGLRYDATV